MPSVCLYFKVHHPFQLKQYHAHDVGACHCYEDAAADEATINKLADACYLPANNILLSAIEKCKGAFKINFSISGVVLDLLRKYRPDVITSFQALADTGCIEIISRDLLSLIEFSAFKKGI